MRRAACALLTLLALPAVAQADGLPVVGVEAGGTGVAAGGVRYVTLPARKGMVVAAVAQRGGAIVASRSFAEQLALPVVAYDGSSGGLAADGRTLVLIRPRTSFPQARTRLAVLDTAGLGVRRRLDLQGDFSFDAISPDGRTLFFIQYQSPTDPTRYQVRAFDMPSGRLDAAPVVDPREPDERMGGNPVTRATSADGRWAYTLYDRPGGEPFVHALDTTARTAHCIDMPMLAGRSDLPGLRLRVGTGLTVVAGALPVADVDLRTFRASEPPAYVTMGLVSALTKSSSWAVVQHSNASQ